MQYIFIEELSLKSPYGFSEYYQVSLNALLNFESASTAIKEDDVYWQWICHLIPHDLRAIWIIW